MAESSMTKRWRNYHPSKTAWFWSLAGAVVLTIVVGFAWGGWTTGGSAREMARDAADDARAQLAATLCVHQFMNAADAGTQLTALKAESRWQRDNFLEEGGWVVIAGLDDMPDGTANLCAQRLVEMEAPAQQASSLGDDASVIQ